MRRLAAQEAGARLLLAEASGGVVGTMRVHLGGDAPLPAELVERHGLGRFREALGEAALGLSTGLLVRPDLRGHGVPFQLVAASVRLQAEHGVALAFCECPPHLIDLYLGLGFRSYAPTRDDPQDGVMVPLVLLMSDLVHAEHIGSPLAPLLAPRADAAAAARLRELVGAPTPGADAARPGAVLYWSQLWSRLERGRDERHVLHGLDEAEVRAVLSQGKAVTCLRGDVLIRKDQGARAVYVILDGTFEVRDGERLLAVRGEGEVVGEIAFLLASPRMSDVVAASDGARVLALNDEVLRKLIDAHPRAAAQLFLNLSRALALKLLCATRPLGPDLPEGS